MRVLLLHNRYRAQGGEERVVRAQADLLVRHGHTVELLERDSASLSRGRAAAGLLGGGIAADAVAAAVRRMRAEIVHAHNVHPTFGWRALAAARAAGAATLLQLHNFRLYCAIAVAYRDGRPCHECRGLDTRPGVRHRCRESPGEAVVYAAGLALQQRRLLGHSDRLIALSARHLALLGDHGLAPERVSIVPNFVPESAWRSPNTGVGPGRHALVAGRLVPEKGFDTAIRAAALAGVPLLVAGDGPDGTRLRALAAELGVEVSFPGWLGGEEMAQALAGAGVVLVPSRCEEAFGYGVLDAIAAGVPVIASQRGGLADLTATVGAVGLDPEDPQAWGRTLAALWTDPVRRRSLAVQGQVRGRAAFGEAPALEALLSAYRTAWSRRAAS
ncbi:MAG TPA: glycosyltransferase family 4 protein [Solirubrobacteraceae bacterium]|nr:glycosyltransferase family 4 protein [Solirubrobacteraceae bacterium]